MAKMRIRRYKGVQTPRWLITYADMVTLLLCLFVMLFATGKATPQQVQLILSAFNNSFGFLTGGQTLSKGSLEELGLNLENLPSQTKGRALSRAKKTAHNVFRSEIKARKVTITEDERGVIISLISADYFQPGSALLSASIEETLQKAASLMQTLERFIRIEGHASPGEENIIQEIQGIAKPQERVYENSWDLSSARAVQVAAFLQKEGVPPAWMQSAGYGAYRPIVKGGGTPETDALHRRVDLVLLTFKSSVRPSSQSEYRLPSSPIPGTESLIEDDE